MKKLTIYTCTYIAKLQAVILFETITVKTLTWRRGRWGFGGRLWFYVCSSIGYRYFTDTECLSSLGSGRAGNKLSQRRRLSRAECRCSKRRGSTCNRLSDNWRRLGRTKFKPSRSAFSSKQTSLKSTAWIDNIYHTFINKPRDC